MIRSVVRRFASHRATAGAVVLLLAGTLAACTENEDTAGTTVPAPESLTPVDPTAGEEDQRTAVVEDSATESSAPQPEQGESVQIRTADGGLVLVDPEFGRQLADYAAEWGEPERVQEGEAGVLATFAEGHLLAYSADTGAHPILGSIAQVWVDDGALTNPIGLPLGPEEENEGESGWSQEFATGTITWARDETGEFTATVS